jgi:hypothetical protein
MTSEGAEIALFTVCLLVGPVATLVGVFMWLGAWATLAVFGVLATLFGLALLNAFAGRPHASP